MTQSEDAGENTTYSQPSSSIQYQVEEQKTPKPERMPKIKPQIKSKNNAIDNDISFAFAFQSRKLLLKGWKSMLIFKMNQILERRLKKQADTFLSKKLKMKSFHRFRVYQKVIKPEEEKVQTARDHYRGNILRRCIIEMREKSRELKERKSKLVSTIAVLRNLKLRKIWQHLKHNIVQKQVQRTQVYACYHLNYQKLKQKCFHSFKLYAMACHRRRTLMIRSLYFSQHQLMLKAFASLRRNSNIKIHKEQRMESARQYHSDRQRESLTFLALSVLRQYAQHQRKQKLSKGQNNYWLKRRFFKLLQIHQIVVAGYRTQIKFVKRFREQKLLQIVFQALKGEKTAEEVKMDMILSFLLRAKQRKILRELQKHYRRKAIFFPPSHGPFILCARAWLMRSFGNIMNGIWQDFPKQKIDRDPETQQKLLLYNYIGISKKPQYLSYFFQANYVAISHLKSKCFRTLRNYAAKIASFKRKRQGEILKVAFKGFSCYCSKQAIIKRLLLNRRMKRNLDTKVIVLQQFLLNAKKYRAVRSFQCRVSVKEGRKMARECFQKWRREYRMVAQQKQSDEYSNKIYRHRVLSFFMAKWLNKLHKKLKKQSLVQRQSKFENQFTRSKFFKLWRKKFMKSEYLNQQEKLISKHKNNGLLSQCFQELIAHSDHSKKMRAMNQAAKQEYLYWLGKRVIQNWEESVRQEQNKRQLYKSLTNDYEGRQVEKLFNSLRTYSSYRSEKRVRDGLMTSHIHSMIKKRCLKTWLGQYNIINGAIMLRNTFKQLQMKESFNKILAYFDYQEDCCDKMALKQIFGLLGSSFNALKVQKQKKELKQTLKVLAKSTYLDSLSRKSFKNWFGLFRLRRSYYTTYAFTVIQFKNQICKSVLQDWRNLIAYKKMKRGADLVSRIKRQRTVFSLLLENSMRRQHIIRAYRQIVGERQVSYKQQALQEWRRRYGVKRLMRNKGVEIVNRQVMKVFSSLKAYSKDKRHFKTVIKERSLEMNKQLVMWEFRRIFRLAQRSKVERALKERAIEFNQASMYKRAAQAWISYYKKNQQHISKMVQFQRQGLRSMGIKFFKQWMKKCTVPLNKIQSIYKLKKVRALKLQKKRFLEWVNQTNFLITLDSNVTKLQKMLKAKNSKRALKELSENSKKRKIERVRDNNLKQYYNCKLSLRVFAKLVAYLDYRRYWGEQKEKALQVYAKNLGQYHFDLARLVTMQEKCLRVSENRMRKVQRKLYGPHGLQQLFANMKERQHYRVLMTSSKQFLRRQLFIKAFKSLFLQVINKSTSRMNIMKADQHYSNLIFAKSIQSMKIFKIYHQQICAKRQMMYERISRVDDDIRKRNLLVMVYGYAYECQQERIAAKQILKIKKTKRILEHLKFNMRFQNRQREAYFILRERNEAGMKEKFFRLLRKEYFLETESRIYRRNSGLDVMKSFLTRLKSKAVLRQKEQLLFVNTCSKLEQKALYSLKSHNLKKKCEYQHQHQCYQFFLRQLIKRSLQALAINVFRERKVQQGIEMQEANLVQRGFNALAMNLRRKQIVKIKQQQREYSMQQWCLSQWQHQFQIKLRQKLRMKQILLKFMREDQEGAFVQWKKGAFFMRMCNLLYDAHNTSESQFELKCGVMSEWRRWTRFSRNSDYFTQEADRFYISGLLTKGLSIMKNTIQVKARAFQYKLDRVVQTKLSEVFNDLIMYSEKDLELEERENQLIQHQEANQKSRIFVKWIISVQHSHQVMVLREKKELSLMKRVFTALEQNKLNQMSKKYQMLRIISFFSDRRPELLLAFSKTFMILNYEHSSEGTTCATALLKYVVEKWKNVKDVIQVGNEIEREALGFRAGSLLKQGLEGWKQIAQMNAKKRNLKISCHEFYQVSLLRKSLEGFKQKHQKIVMKREASEKQMDLLTKQCQGIFSKYFAHWKERAYQKQRLREIEHMILQNRALNIQNACFITLQEFCQEKQIQRNIVHEAKLNIVESMRVKLLDKYFQALLFGVQKSQVEKEQNEIAFAYYSQNLIKKVFSSMRETIFDQKEKGRLSKLYSIYAAWKFYTKENLLLKKYLEECNFQSSVKPGKKAKITIDYESKENIFKSNGNGLDNSGKSRQHSKSISQQQFTPTLAEPLNSQKPLGLRDNLHWMSNANTSSNEEDAARGGGGNRRYQNQRLI